MLISIALAPRIPENIVVYRGVLNSFIRELKIDRIKDFWKRYKGFLSTSLISKFVLDEGYEAILRIYLPKGIYGAYVTKISGRPQEQEMLFPPNAFLKLLDSKIIYKEKTNWYEGGTSVMKMEIQLNAHDMQYIEKYSEEEVDR